MTSLAAALKNRQREDGFWNMNLDDPNDNPGPETSGTALFTYGMAWGINNGLLDKDEYLPIVAKAWKGLCTIAVQPNGNLRYTQNVGEKPIPVSQLAGNSVDFGVGAFLLAASEVVKLASGDMPAIPGIDIPDVNISDVAEMIMQRVREAEWEKSGSVDALDAEVATLLSTLQADGSWTDNLKEWKKAFVLQKSCKEQYG